MSYIDTFDHEYLGNIGYLPIYHPLITVESIESEGDFPCSPSTLVLGGGGGEHPGLVIHDLNYAVACFLLECTSDIHENSTNKEAILFLQEIMCKLTNEPFKFYGWSIRDTAKLLEMAESNLNNMPVQKNQSVEDWLLTSIGEFVFYSLPELHSIPSWVIEALKISVRPIMKNVSCIPPGYPISFGRSTNQGTITWGCSRWNYHVPNPSINRDG